MTIIYTSILLVCLFVLQFVLLIWIVNISGIKTEYSLEKEASPSVHNLKRILIILTPYPPLENVSKEI